MGKIPLIEIDPYLKPYEKIIEKRIKKIEEQESALTDKGSLLDFATSHKYFGLHKEKDHWVFREWAPNATEIYFIGDMTNWQLRQDFKLHRIESSGVWELSVPLDKISHGDLYKLIVRWDGGEGERIPSYANYVVQDPNTKIFSAKVWAPDEKYIWKYDRTYPFPDPVLIYEAHVGMAVEEERVGTYREFTENILPRIKELGYNVIQLMAIQEHPYYGSFGYQVSSFFAPSSRFGTPDELKELIDTAHSLGMYVIMDIIHSHAAPNEVEGLSRFDGSYDLYFHKGKRGYHPLWGSRCFDYSKKEVIRFLLSNLRYFLEEFHVDGFRFDGITSMLYTHHGIGKDFVSYDDYFGEDVDEDALVYLALANKLVHSVNPNAITIAEDVSGMPGLCFPVSKGGIGFDYRFAMGIADYWIKLIKHMRDEDWPMGKLWYELTNHRIEEKTISYAESHDQALVGDQTIIFRLIGADMYFCMRKQDENLKVDRGIALHKMIRFITLTTACAGYLNFMGNEFGHPEWIDFPREGNNWSYKYARRQWSLSENPLLRYEYLLEFDKDMIEFVKQTKIISPDNPPRLLYEHNENKIICFERGEYIFVFNFHPIYSFTDYRIYTTPGKYELVFCSDRRKYGGFERLRDREIHFTLVEKYENHLNHYLSLYIPNRCAFVLKKVE
jgi:1,4-alpha-glucan branching enzyme